MNTEINIKDLHTYFNKETKEPNKKELTKTFELLLNKEVITQTEYLAAITIVNERYKI